MKKIFKMTAVALSLATLVACSNESAPATEGQAPAEAVTLVGTAEGFGGPVEVTVTKEGDVITNVEVTNHSESIDDIAEVKTALETLPAAIVEANGVDGVEGISGATYTSEAIFNAVKDAK